MKEYLLLAIVLACLYVVADKISGNLKEANGDEKPIIKNNLEAGGTYSHRPVFDHSRLDEIMKSR